MLSQLRREIGVLRRIQSLLENRVHADEVEIPQHLLVEPQTGETLRLENTIRARPDRLETLRRPRYFRFDRSQGTASITPAKRQGRNNAAGFRMNDAILPTHPMPRAAAEIVARIGGE